MFLTIKLCNFAELNCLIKNCFDILTAYKQNLYLYKTEWAELELFE